MTEDQDIQINITNAERVLLLATIENATYAGKAVAAVAALIVKLETAAPKE